MIQSIFHPNQLHSRFHFPKEMKEYLSKRLKNVKNKYHKHGEDEFYTDTYEPGEVALGWSKEYIQSMKSRTVSVEALNEWSKCFSACNQYVYDCRVR